MESKASDTPCLLRGAGGHLSSRVLAAAPRCMHPFTDSTFSPTAATKDIQPAVTTPHHPCEPLAKLSPGHQRLTAAMPNPGPGLEDAYPKPASVTATPQLSAPLRIVTEPLGNRPWCRRNGPNLL
jgi:hypothetical protein